MLSNTVFFSGIFGPGCLPLQNLATADFVHLKDQPAWFTTNLSTEILHLTMSKTIFVPSQVFPYYRQILIVWLRCHIRLHRKMTLFGFPNCSRMQSGATTMPSALIWKGNDIFSGACSGTECDQIDTHVLGKGWHLKTCVFPRQVHQSHCTGGVENAPRSPKLGSHRGNCVSSDKIYNPSSGVQK